MRRSGGIRPPLAGLLTWAGLVLGPAGVVRVLAAAPEPPGHLQSAAATQAATRPRLRVLGDAFSCVEARFVSYRRSEAEPEVVDRWYVAAQLWADAQLLLAASAETTPRPTALSLERAPRGPCRTGRAPVLSDRYFNYDQGIIIEAQLLAAGLDSDPGRFRRAQTVGRAAHETFWGSERSGYNLEAGIEQVYTAFAAWTSLGHLALYDADRDARWLELARANADALAATLGEPDGGHARRHYRCVDCAAPGCENGDIPWVVGRTRDTAAQALMQHLQVGIARRAATVDQATPTGVTRSCGPRALPAPCRGVPVVAADE